MISHIHTWARKWGEKKRIMSRMGVPRRQMKSPSLTPLSLSPSTPRHELEGEQTLMNELKWKIFFLLEIVLFLSSYFIAFCGPLLWCLISFFSDEDRLDDEEEKGKKERWWEGSATSCTIRLASSSSSKGVGGVFFFSISLQYTIQEADEPFPPLSERFSGRSEFWMFIILFFLYAWSIYSNGK